ncbi:hypothetical protein PPSIR1_09321 [Plesiocystis pacifica SIR-1]|uniref:Uncharacterized protein n=1 Tax=Plesiocystis pacifica SIR-1 TaxID=391625 RepID=A6GIL1_9BACT|nr:hypothetical protein PPSIR1_09321 [Plesiocystis pacifica SIR-1]
MLPCPVCKRHIHASEASCPFCGARQDKTALSGGLFVGMMVLASTLGGGAIGCAPGDVDLDEGSDTVGDTSAPMTTASTADEADEADEDWGEQGGSFYAGPADEEEGETGSPLVCNVFLQDCPEGEKCVAVMEGKGEASYSRECVPVVGEKAVGEACVHDGPALGTDDCDTWGSCWVEDSEGKGGVSGLLCGRVVQPVVRPGDPVRGRPRRRRGALHRALRARWGALSGRAELRVGAGAG